MNANLSQARDGRASVAFHLETSTASGASLMKTGSLAVGDIGFVVAKGASSCFPEGVKVNTPFIAVKAYTLADGDEFLKCKVLFLGQATGKTVSETKNTSVVTIDYDSVENSITDGIVSKSGSISGSNVTESLKMESAVNMIKSRFDRITEIEADGSTTVREADTTRKDQLLIIWNGRNAKVGDLLDMEVVPVLYTSQSRGGQYGSAQSLDLDWTGNAVDDNGFEGGLLQVENVAGLLPALVRPVLPAA